MRAIPCRCCAQESAGLVVSYKLGIWLRDRPTIQGKRLKLLPAGMPLRAVPTDTLAQQGKGHGAANTDWIQVEAEGIGIGWVLKHGRNLRPSLGRLVAESGPDRQPLISEEQEEYAIREKITKGLSAAKGLWLGLASILLPPIPDLDVYEEEPGLAETVLDFKNLGPDTWMPLPAVARLHDPSPSTPLAEFRRVGWICERCGKAPENEEQLLALERLLGRLAERTFFSPQMTPTLGLVRNRFDPKGGLKMVKQSFVLHAAELAAVALGVLGLHHWAVNWARLLFVDLLVARLTYTTGRRILVAGETLLSFLLCLWSWLDRLGLAHDPGCFLHARVDQALRTLGPEIHGFDEGFQQLFSELKRRSDESRAQVEILPLRTLIIDGTISFA